MTNLTSKEAKMGKVMRHTLGASLNIRHNLSSSKGPKPLQLKLLTTYIPKTSSSFSHSTRNKTRDGLIRVRNIRALNGRFNTSITHPYSIVIGSKHITLNATGGGFLPASKQFRHGATSKSRRNTASNSTKH